MPPRGHSKDSDFDLLCHLELEPEKEDKKGEEEEGEGDQAAGDVKHVEIKYKSTVPNISDFWLQVMPNSKDYIQSVCQCFQEGLESISKFKRWNKHEDLSPYADALEEWDDIVGDQWEIHDDVNLDPLSWINENRFFTD